MEKIRIRKQVPNFDLDIVEDKLETVICNLQQIYNELTDVGWTELKLEVEYNEYNSYVLSGMQIETDDEYQKRIDRIEKAKHDELLMIEKEKAELQRLLSKFGLKL